MGVWGDTFCKFVSLFVQGLLLCCENYYKQLHPVLFVYHPVLIVYTNPTCQSNATVDVCATVLSKSQNAFLLLSSLIKERKETTRCARLLFWDVDRVWIIMYMYLVSMP